VAGPKTNLAFLEALARHPAVVEGRIDTGYLDRHLDEFIDAGAPVPASLLAAACSAWLLRAQAGEAMHAAAGGDPGSPWAIADGWRLHGRAPRRLRLQAGGAVHAATATGHGGDWQVVVDGTAHVVAGARLADAALDLRVDGQGRHFAAFFDADLLELHDGHRRLSLRLLPAERGEGTGAAGGDGRVLAPMPGRVVLVKADAGQPVAAGGELLVMEAMKMELTVRAPHDGVLAELRVAAGDFVEADALLAVVAAADPA
jgi:3-methylcrotonyl-CoA carboxylase alpha subunit